MTKFMDEDVRRAATEAVISGKPPPGEADAYRAKRKIRSSRRSRGREKEVKSLLREARTLEALFSRGDADFPEFDGGDF